MIYNRIQVAFGSLRKATAPAIPYQYDVVQKLIIKGLELPEYYQVDFCNDGDTSTITMVGTADGVNIPDQFLQTGRNVKAYLVVTGTDEGAVETRYEITIPVNKRPTRTDIEPTPVEQSTIDSLIAAMNDAVDDAEASATAAEGYAANAEASAERAEQAAQSIDGKVERAEAAAQAAGVSATRAEDAAEDALTYKNAAEQSAGSASSSAENARDCQETAIEKAAEAEQSAAQAAASAESADGDAQEAEQAAQQATQAASAASQSATAAQGSATAASGSATVATNKAAEANASAITASGKATEAANSATAAQAAQTGAEAAQAASEAAQQAAEEAAQSISESAAQIAQNTSDIADLDDDVSELKNAITNVIQFTPLLFTVGGIIGASGADNDVTNRLRTFTYMPEGIYDVTSENGYSFSVFAWDTSGVYQGKIITDGTISTSGTVKWHTYCDFYKLAKENPSYVWKIVVKNSTGTNIAVTESVNVKARTANKSIQNIPVIAVPNVCSDIYTLYDEFVSSGYATKETLATIETLPLNLYKFSIQNTFATGASNSPDATYKNHQKKAVLFTSGMHGDEKGAVIGLYNLMRNMCFDSEFKKYLSVYDFYVIPIANPTGYNSDTRNNYQDININRLDEGAETVEVIALKQIADARYYELSIDFHNCPGSRSVETINEAIGAMSFATDTERSERQKQFDIYKKAFSGFYKDVNEIFSKNISFTDQLLFPWVGTNYSTWRNYVYKKKKLFGLGTTTSRKFIRATTGNEVTSSSEPYLSCTDYIDVSGVHEITYRQINSTSATAVTNGIAFYDENKTFISGVGSNYGATQAHYSDNTVTLPLNAKYARFSMYEDTETYGEFYCYSFVGSPISACNETSNYCYKISESTVKENNSSSVCSISHIRNVANSFLSYVSN